MLSVYVFLSLQSEHGLSRLPKVCDLRHLKYSKRQGEYNFTDRSGNHVVEWG